MDNLIGEISAYFLIFSSILGCAHILKKINKYIEEYIISKHLEDYKTLIYAVFIILIFFIGTIIFASAGEYIRSM